MAAHRPNLGFTLDGEDLMAKALKGDMGIVPALDIDSPEHLERVVREKAAQTDAFTQEDANRTHSKLAAYRRK